MSQSRSFWSRPHKTNSFFGLGLALSDLGLGHDLINKPDCNF